MRRKVRLGVLGGAFNPVHRFHLRMARAARHRLGLDRVLLIPARIPPHKIPDSLAPARHRLRMLELSVASYARLEASDIELRRKGPSYTVDTLRRMRRGRPGAEWFLIIGADNAEILPRWKRIRELVKWVTFVVVPRCGHPWRKPDLPGLRIHTLRLPRSPISSTEIRRRIREGRSIRALVPPVVADYIKRHRLYGRTLRP